eukprot:s1907_g13.t1
MNQMAMVPGGQNTSKAHGKGKKFKGEGKNFSTTPPSAEARGRAVMGSLKCLRCGMAVHYAKACPQSVKRKADGPDGGDAIRRDIMVSVITGQVQFLLGRPLMEELQVSIDYAEKKIKWGNAPWKLAQLGPK